MQSNFYTVFNAVTCSLSMNPKEEFSLVLCPHRQGKTCEKYPASRVCHPTHSYSYLRQSQPYKTTFSDRDKVLKSSKESYGSNFSRWIFFQKAVTFFNFNGCLLALLALSHLLQLIFLVNHVGRSPKNKFLDLPPHVKYLKITSKHR